jgi:hypothetical protein
MQITGSGNYDGALQSLLAIHLHLGSLTAGLRAAQGQAERIAEASQRGESQTFVGQFRPSQLAQGTYPTFNLVLYLCARNCEIRDTRSLKGRRNGPVEIWTKNGPLLFPPNRATTWDVAYRTGAELMRAIECNSSSANSSERNSPCPQIRRASWHAYYVGQTERRPSCAGSLPSVLPLIRSTRSYR